MVEINLHLGEDLSVDKGLKTKGFGEYLRPPYLILD